MTAPNQRSPCASKTNFNPAKTSPSADMAVRVQQSAQAQVVGEVGATIRFARPSGTGGACGLVQRDRETHALGYGDPGAWRARESRRKRDGRWSGVAPQHFLELRVARCHTHQVLVTDANEVTSDPAQAHPGRSRV